ncbi:hypothetical protein V1514DRAFT_295894 [Lipomyces japonicus]|uniref:uncharacterized protein n=1 Tax=Lipomyces japonicus TaxID=56871 RepID=UPI0034CDB5C2
MLLSLVATLVSLLWLLHRATRLLQIPIPTLVQLLGIDIPLPPHVCLDAVTSDSVTLHWSLPDRASSVAKHVIQMNGQNVGESEKRETTVTITGLNPDQIYGIRVLAVNSSQYSAAGQLIRLRTRRKSEDLILTSIQPITQEPIASVESIPTKGKSDSLLVHTQFKRGAHRSVRHLSPHRRDRHESSSFTAATQPYTLESLAAELEQIRSEISETIVQQAHAEEEYVVQELALQAELETLREKRKEEDGVRAQWRSENKALEEQKRNLEAQKSKVERVAKQKIENLEKIATDFNKWSQEIQNASVRKVEIDNLLVKVINDSKQKTKHAKESIQQKHKQIAILEDEIRGLISKVKKAEIEKDPKTGDANENAFAKLLHAEDMEDWKLERNWQETQKGLEMRYVNVFEQYRDAEENLRKAQEILTSLTMHGTLPQSLDVSKSVKRRNRPRNKSARQSVSSPISSYPLHDPRFPEASTFNNLQYPSLHSSFFHATSNSSSSSGAPSAVSNSSSSLPLNPFSINSRPLNLFPETYDTSLSNDEFITTDGPTSPNVDMLLPSNLFVTDDILQSEIESRERTDTLETALSLDNNSSNNSSLLLPALQANVPSSTGKTSSSFLLSAPSSASPSPQPAGLHPTSYSSISLSNTTTPIVSVQPSFPFFPSLKTASPLSSPPSPLLENLSTTHSNSSGGASSLQDSIVPVISSAPPVGSSLISVLNASADMESDDNASLTLHTSRGSSHSSGGFSNLVKRSPTRRLMFGGMTGISAIGNIGRKKDSMEAVVTMPQLPLASEDDFIILPHGEGEPRTPNRRLANLFSFSKPRSGATLDVVVPAGTTDLRQAPIGTRRRSGSYGSYDSPTGGGVVSDMPQASPAPGHSNSLSGLLNNGVGSLFASSGNVFSRRGSKISWDLSFRSELKNEAKTEPNNLPSI